MTMKKSKPIVLTARTRPAQESCHVSMTPDAYAVVMRLKRLTGRTVRSLMSEIMLQVDDLIEIQYDDEREEEEENE